MKIGLQTHFGVPVGTELCQQLVDFGFRVARIDAQGSNWTREMVEETLSVGLEPLIIVNTLEALRELPSGLHAEWTNELDGDISASDYRDSLDLAAAVAKERGIFLWAPALSNLDQDSFQWLNDVKGSGWPEGLHGISVHRYGNGAFEPPHDGFANRDREVFWLKVACAGLPFLVSEFGYPGENQGSNIAKEFDFWARHGAYAAILYQLNDGSGEDEKYGIRRQDGSWKEDVLAAIPIAEATFAVVTSPAVSEALLLTSQGPSAHTNEDGYAAVQVLQKPLSFSLHKEGYLDYFSEPIRILGNTQVEALLVEQKPYPFPDEKGGLRIDSEWFYDHSGRWQWRGYSWFLGFLRYCRGEDVTPDLKWLRKNGFNIVRVFGPLSWKETPDYRAEMFRFDLLGDFFSLLSQYGLRCEFVPGCYRFDGWQDFLQTSYDIAAEHENVLIECVNEPFVGEKPDAKVKVNRHGVISAYGIYPKPGQPYRDVPSLDYGTVHTPRDDSWYRKARIAQEIQHSKNQPWISDEPAKAIETDFEYPGGKRNPDEFVWHHGVASIFTAGSTLHTEFGKWGTIPAEGSLQAAIAAAVRDNVWFKLSAACQGSYSGAHMSICPVDGRGLKIDGKDIWTYASIDNPTAAAVRCAISAPQAKPGWAIVERWGPGGSLVTLKET